MLEFLLIPLIVAILSVCSLSSLGCFVVWRKMAYFGDTIAHSSLLSVVIAFFLKVDIYFALLIGALIFASFAYVLIYKYKSPEDASFVVISNSALAFSLIAISFYPTQQIEFNNFLFGDLLAVSTTDVIVCLLTSLLIVSLVIFFWKKLLLIAISVELAIVEKINTNFLQLILMLILSIAITVFMKSIGALLTTSLLVIPAISSSQIAKNPESMILISMTIGFLSATIGVFASWFIDIPVAPAIIFVAFVGFIISSSLKAFVKLRI